MNPYLVIMRFPTEHYIRAAELGAGRRVADGAVTHVVSSAGRPIGVDVAIELPWYWWRVSDLEVEQLLAAGAIR